MSLTSLSLETIFETTKLFGGPLESPLHIQTKQELHLLPNRISKLQVSSNVHVTKENAKNFFYGSVDFMPLKNGAETSFQILEFNGTGTYGLTNLPMDHLGALLEQMTEVAKFLEGPNPLVLCPLSMKTKRLVLERVLVAQALKEGLRRQFGKSRITIDADSVGQDSVIALIHRPRSFLKAENGLLYLQHRKVDAAHRDLFCQHLHSYFPQQLNADAFFAMNNIFPICTDKGTTYELYNRFIEKTGSRFQSVDYKVADTPEELRDLVYKDHKIGKSLVLKPTAAGAARGVEFLFSHESDIQIKNKLDDIIDSSREKSQDKGCGYERYHGFPYTICKMLDSAVIENPKHRFWGHRYELRILVYRIGLELRAFPSLCKVSSQRFDAGTTNREMMLNTLSSSLRNQEPETPFNEFALPLCNSETLEALNLEANILEELCDMALAFVQFAIEQKPLIEFSKRNSARTGSLTSG